MPRKPAAADALRDFEDEARKFIEAGGTIAQLEEIFARAWADHNLSPAERSVKIARVREELGLDDDEPEPPSKAH